MARKKQKPTLLPDELAQLIKDSPEGIIDRRDLQRHWQDINDTIRQARRREDIATYNELVYDPQRVDKEYAIQLAHQNGRGVAQLPDFTQIIRQTLADANAPAMVRQDLEAAVGDYFSVQLLRDDILEEAGVHTLELKLFEPYNEWFYLSSQEYDRVYDHALTVAAERHDAEWLEIAEWAGDEQRVGAQPGETARSVALSRLYSRSQAESVLDISERVFRIALRDGILARRVCPDGAKRMRAADVHHLQHDPDLRQTLEDKLEINIWQIRNLTGLKISYLRTLLHNDGVRPSSRSRRKSSHRGKNSAYYRWGAVRKVLWPAGDHPTMSDIDIIEETGGAGKEAWWSDKIIEIHREIDAQKQQQREARERRRQQREAQREALRAQMIENFPKWLAEEEVEQIAYIHVGPTNSGKTHDALQELAAAGSGWYLAPLRLLAREMFERLNKMGVYCNLLTGEERINVPGATFTAATVEMFNAGESGNCVVLDEAHMVADEQRGWAWTRALVNSQAPQMRVITAPHGLNLLSKIFQNRGIEIQILYHERLVPLEVAPEAWPIEDLPNRTILIAFSRRDVLRLKYVLQQRGRSVSVVYGALPPEVRLRQAQRFAYGETDICVATDAVGMGLNLPADNVVFSTLTKFDGRELRRIDANECQQIAGRAGRFGLSDKGWVTGVDDEMLRHIRHLMHQQVPSVEYARLAPRTDELELLEGDLAQRLITWQQLNAIPDELRDIVSSTEMDEKIELARLLSYEDLMYLGIDRALTLVNAPTRKESWEYWVECATAILRDEMMPAPPPPPNDIREGATLKQAEASIACMDIYLWLSYREPFQHLAEEPQAVVEQREELTRQIDLALMRRFDPTLAGRRGRRRGAWFEED
ncbi:MAG: helicase-related protein [Anaerolineales bacterium]